MPAVLIANEHARDVRDCNTSSNFVLRLCRNSNTVRQTAVTAILRLSIFRMHTWPARAGTTNRLFSALLFYDQPLVYRRILNNLLVTTRPLDLDSIYFFARAETEV